MQGNIQANFFMTIFEINAKSSIKHIPRVWVRHRNDIFAGFYKNEKLGEFCNRINGFYPTIKSTTGIEK